MGRYLAPFILIVVGVALLATSGWFVRDTLQLRDRATRVDGRIASYSSRRDSDGDMTYRPTYAFRYEGKQREHASRIGSSSRPDVGSEVTLLVDPDDPTRVKPETFMGQWFVPTLLGAIGLVFTIVGLFVGVALSASRRASTASPTTVPTTSPADEAKRGDAEQRGPFL